MARVLNEKLLLETLEHIKTHPQTWRQSTWYVWLNEETGRSEVSQAVVNVEEVNSCGSAFCFAGHAALKAGFVAPPKENWRDWRDSDGTDVDRFATEKLGIAFDQASVLFDPGNSMKELETIVSALIADPNITGRQLEKMVFWPDEDVDYDEDDDAYHERYF